jgi:disulfide bond formation protein DsbB
MAAGFGSLLLIGGALGFQYLDGIVPCEMCHWQRWPHIAAAILGIGVAFSRAGRGLGSIVIGPAAGIGLFLGWEWGMLKGWQPDLLALIIVALIATGLWKGSSRQMAITIIGLIVISGLIGAYQTGMQMHLLPGPSACTAPRYILGSNAPPPVIDCNVVTWSLFGLSLAAYNAIFSFLIAGLATLALKARA